MSLNQSVPLPRPNLAESHPIFQLASTGQADQMREELRARGRESLYYFSKVVMGFDKLSPNFHLDRCQEVQDSQWMLKRGFLWPRGHFKSTILTKSYPLWRLSGGGFKKINLDDSPYSSPKTDPRNLRFYLQGESDTRVCAAVRNVKWHLQNNQMLRWLYPEIIPPDVNKTTWRDDEILLPRSLQFDESTIRAVGVKTRTTGYHGNVFIFDDIIGEKAAASEAEMEAANEALEYAFGLADDPEIVEWIFAGTRWKHGKADSYGKLIDEQPFWVDTDGRPHGIKWFIYSAIKDNGEPSFPERFSIPTLEEIRKQLKTYKFSCQYLNTPTPPEGGDFPDGLIKSFIGEGSILRPSDGTPPCDLKDLLRIAFYDLSSGGQSATCENFIVVLGTHADGRRFALDAFYKNCGYREALEGYYRLNDQYFCYQCWFESIGAQKEITSTDEQAILLRKLNKNKCPYKEKEHGPECGKDHRKLRLQGYSHQGFKGNKEDRIRHYLQPTVEEGRLYLNAKLQHLRVQLTSFPHYHLVDGADALASAVHLSRPPLSSDEIKSQEIEAQQRQQPKEARVNTDRVYGGYA